MGAEIARTLVARGAQVLISDLDSVELSDLGVELDMATMHCDVTDREQVVALGRAAMEEWGRIDLWINNAGVWTPYTPVDNVDFNKAHQLVEVNYFGIDNVAATTPAEHQEIWKTDDVRTREV